MPLGYLHIRNRRNSSNIMEYFIIIPITLAISYLYLTRAPMHEIQSAIYHAENIANQKAKYEKTI